MVVTVVMCVPWRQAPHIEDGPGWPATIPAPWYADAFPGTQAPRTPNYNYSALDHHCACNGFWGMWVPPPPAYREKILLLLLPGIVSQQPPMTEEQVGSRSLHRCAGLGTSSERVAWQATYADILFRRRWQSLLSVDDLIESRENRLRDHLGKLAEQGAGPDGGPALLACSGQHLGEGRRAG
jgi:N-acetylglucosamine-6-sulfatase